MVGTDVITPSGVSALHVYSSDNLNIIIWQIEIPGIQTAHAQVIIQ